MKENWNRLCAGLLVIILLSACGKGTGQQPAQTSPGAGSTDAKQTEAVSAGSMTEAQQAEGWTCSCGQTGNVNRFCINCGNPKPEPAAPASEAAAPAGEVTTPAAAQRAPAEEVTTPVAAQPAPMNNAPAPSMMDTAPVQQTVQQPAEVYAPQYNAPQPAAGLWACECGFTGNTGAYCLNCGARRPF